MNTTVYDQYAGVRFIHVRPGQHYNGRRLVGKAALKGGLTVAYQLTARGTIIQYALAQCSPEDNYSRAKGRVISHGRLLKPWLTMLLPVVPTQSHVATIMAHVRDTQKPPRRERAGAPQEA